MRLPAWWLRGWQRRWVRRLIKGVVLPLLILFILIEMVDGVLMPWLTRHGREFPAPSVVGLTIERAQSVLADIGSPLEIAERRYSPYHPDGTVMEQRPTAGARIKNGRAFKVVVSRGSELVEVPRVRGFTVRQAELILTESGFVLGGRIASPDSSLPPGTVVGTIPGAGGRLPRASVINLLVNEEVRGDSTWCPNLAGMNVEEAWMLLRERGLLLGIVNRRRDSNRPAGTIVEQSPAAGEGVAVGTEVDIVIAWER